MNRNTKGKSTNSTTDTGAGETPGTYANNANEKIKKDTKISTAFLKSGSGEDAKNNMEGKGKMTEAELTSLEPALPTETSTLPSYKSEEDVTPKPAAFITPTKLVNVGGSFTTACLTSGTSSSFTSTIPSSSLGGELGDDRSLVIQPSNSIAAVGCSSGTGSSNEARAVSSAVTAAEKREAKAKRKLYLRPYLQDSSTGNWRSDW